MNNQILYPNDTIGIIGDSVSGPSLVSTAKKIGFQVGAYGSDETSPTLQLADFKIVGDANDKEKLRQFAESCKLVTFASSHVSADVIRYLEQFTLVPQGAEMLEMSQDRLLERAFFEQLNVNIAPYATIVSLDDVYQSINSIGYPSILKPIQKDLIQGQELLIETQADIAKASGLLDYGTYILESIVPNSRELSITLARDQNGQTQLFPAVETVREKGKIKWAFIPTQLDVGMAQELRRIANEVTQNIQYVGLLEVSFTITQNDNIYVKRILPTVSHVGQIFDRGTTASQYEQHLRAISGLPLSEPQTMMPTVWAPFTVSQLEAINRQWVLKSNWHFTFYRRSQRNQPLADQLAGNVILQTPDLNEALDQLEDTGVWTKE
ncbi:phosphoribosylaminoimidazole carboxylase [Secundilactobacillus oryzae JCM 18671]|uniref:Phosphoribosylaminoimidazole carboxylase n=1 Tax=Secundilactobacillus oryzae JCM 18671 TaxID=1291743 RepID=A0A081BK50_9LACO|nr:ATP-grasp domain-containing protein [Secundilactobacillus oryzae]GAK48418.1 phosphoribosylaminoimidazole carboxylase [Secundilactobacillus oryzae JCM 18671]